MTEVFHVTSRLWKGAGLAKRAFLLSVSLPLAACSSMGDFDASKSLNPTNWFKGEKYEAKVIPDVPADDIYNQGLVRLQKKDYEAAGKKFADLEKQYPYSQWQKKGLLMSAYSQYQNGSYDDAIASAQRYYTLYPNAPDTPYAYYLAAMSNYNQIPDVSRDQERAQKAAVLFQQIAEKFPKSEYGEDAKYKLQVCRDQLAGKEMFVGRYYLNNHNYIAAVNRFREVLAKYQTTRHSEEALMRLTEAYLALGIVNEAQTAAAVLGHNFPDSQWYKDSYALLQDKGLQPQEEKGSWISNIFPKTWALGDHGNKPAEPEVKTAEAPPPPAITPVPTRTPARRGPVTLPTVAPPEMRGPAETSSAQPPAEENWFSRTFHKMWASNDGESKPAGQAN
ncbi:DNA uptake lipoprotein-like protein [Beijerinckia indica subsp. indica ATCC 9039]|uniref:Outer membrane protein assembly factor BamD n=1 Tax=Beijerinckia indica subsp. indica (strain ATCC 9039 / DSM 1715 / NCIMB 8712) TaxID=395963 RepID=B2IGG7_BEII9|nr:DNA uptake lipoprotein-like protein [Beijerinckia indica subsp. indica ATCC 9039]